MQGHYIWQTWCSTWFVYWASPQINAKIPEFSAEGWHCIALILDRYFCLAGGHIRIVRYSDIWRQMRLRLTLKSRSCAGCDSCCRRSNILFGRCLRRCCSRGCLRFSHFSSNNVCCQLGRKRAVSPCSRWLRETIDRTRGIQNKSWKINAYI